MLTNVHLRGVSLESVVESIETILAEEGFELTEEDVADGEIRRVALYEKDGWIGIADDPFADTSWGEELSLDLETLVVTMSGDDDHAFFTSITLHNDGDLIASSNVPDDAVLEADGRSRIRPMSLAPSFPAARAAIEAGIVVDRLGGKENFEAIGGLLGIPRPLFGADAPGSETVLTFAYEGGGKERPPADFEDALGQLLGAFGEAVPDRGMLERLASDLTSGMMSQLDITGEPDVLDTEPAARLPIVPDWADAKAHPHHVRTYGGSAYGYALFCFDAEWNDVADFVLRVAREVLAVLGKKPFEASMRRKGGENLTFPAGADFWPKIVPELARGADVVLWAGDPFEGPAIAITHQPEGSNFFPAPVAKHERRPPPVILSWCAPRMVFTDDVIAIARAAVDEASAIPTNLGAIVSAQDAPLRGPTFETPYESIVDTRLKTYDARWLSTHARSPGWLVLVPPKAAGAGVLASDARDPFVWAESDAARAASETAVLPAIGTPAELAME